MPTTASLRGAATGWISVLAVALLLFSAASARAAVPSQLAEFGAFGSGAGQTNAVTAIAADPSTGEVFLGEQGGARVSVFSAYGEFLRTWGWGVRNGADELQVCTAATGCQEATRGSGAGQFEWANGLAVSPAGDVYVFDRPNLRVQKFDSEGKFLLMWGGEVNKTTGEDICTAAQLEAGDECGAGLKGTGDGEFGLESVQGLAANYISVAADGTVYVGDRNRIQLFEPDGSFKSSIPLPQPGNPGALSVDRSSGDVYFSYSQGAGVTDIPDVYRLNASGAVLDTLAVTVPKGIATDNAGNVFVLEWNTADAGDPEVLEWGSNGAPIIEHGSGFTSAPPGPLLERPTELAISTNVVTSTGGVDLFTTYDVQDPAFVRIYGPPPDKWPAPAKAPEIDAEFASAASAESATVKARINPNFWADTSYHAEFGLAPCSAGGCTSVPVTGELELGAGVTNATVLSEGLDLTGLQPNTTYHFRFVAQSSGGGPTVGSDQTFKTFNPEPPPRSDCPNQAFRTGPSALLSNCRAYELVSPVDKEGGEILGICNINCFQARTDQASVAGDRISYSSYRAFASPESAPWASQYMSSRGPGGWQTDPISTPREGAAFIFGPSNDAQYKAFLDDLSVGWLLSTTEPVLAPGGVPGFANLYRFTVDSPSLQALTTVAPSVTLPENYLPEVQGFSRDGAHVVFRAPTDLSGDAQQIYEYSDGEIHLVGVLPNGKAAASASVGTPGEAPDNRSHSVFNAVSEDGSRIYWSTRSFAGETAAFFVRVDGSKTIRISAEEAQFRGAAADGSRAIYTRNDGSLFDFDLESNKSKKIAAGVSGVMGMSDDASRVYFTSETALAPGGIASKPNLYLSEPGGTIRYIATLNSADTKTSADAGAGISVAALQPFNRISRVSADGMHAVFMSKAPLTGYDNTDQNSGEADTEVFLYDAEGAGSLVCVSCNPGGARPAGQTIKVRNKRSNYWVAGQIPVWETQFHASRILSADGDRLFFESYDALLPRDVNGAKDVYEWSRLDTGECSEQSAYFAPASNGCISLISDGVTPRDSEFIDADASGRDVFISTPASLVPQDPGLRDIYDARIGGGFAPPPAPAPECAGEACQAQVPAPSSTPLQSTTTKAGNPKSKNGCPKGSHKVKGKGGKSHCAKNKTPRKGKASKDGGSSSFAFD